MLRGAPVLCLRSHQPLLILSTGYKNQSLGEIMKEERKGNFRVLDIGLPKSKGIQLSARLPKRMVVKAPAREKQMKPEQDWMSVWPAMRSFHPAAVPLPVRQGVVQIKNQVTPGKYGNVELIKIPNFLHIPPPVIKRQCRLLQQFCTPWPTELDDPEVLEAHYPVRESTTDYLNSSSSIRDHRSRIVTVRFKVRSLSLQYRDRDKLIRLLGPSRYSHVDDMATITADRCPYRQQNRDYCEYLIKALFFECSRHEEWETKEESDQEAFVWDISRGSAVAEVGDAYKKALTELMNTGENMKTLRDYKKAALDLYSLRDDKIPVEAEVLKQ